MKRIVPAHGHGIINRMEKGDPPLNPNGGPRKLLSQINKDLLQQGIERVTATQIMEFYELALNFTDQDIADFIADKNKPRWARTIMTFLSKLDQRDVMGIVGEMMDRAHGRARQLTELTGKDGKPLTEREPLIININGTKLEY